MSWARLFREEYEEIDREMTETLKGQWPLAHIHRLSVLHDAPGFWKWAGQHKQMLSDWSHRIIRVSILYLIAHHTTNCKDRQFRSSLAFWEDSVRIFILLDTLHPEEFLEIPRLVRIAAYVRRHTVSKLSPKRHYPQREKSEVVLEWVWHMDTCLQEGYNWNNQCDVNEFSASIKFLTYVGEVTSFAPRIAWPAVLRAWYIDNVSMVQHLMEKVQNTFLPDVPVWVQILLRNANDFVECKESTREFQKLLDRANDFIVKSYLQ